MCIKKTSATLSVYCWFENPSNPGRMMINLTFISNHFDLWFNFFSKQFINKRLECNKIFSFVHDDFEVFQEKMEFVNEINEENEGRLISLIVFSISSCNLSWWYS